MATPAEPTLQEKVMALVQAYPNTPETISDLGKTIDALLEEKRQRVDRLLTDKSDAAEQPDVSSAPLPQPKILPLLDSDDETISIHILRPETSAEVQSEWSTIQAALERNPEFMRLLKAHEDMGAELTVVRIVEEDGKRFAEFENVANDLDIKKQEIALAAILNDQAKVDAYVQYRISQLDEDDQEKVERWMRELLQRPPDVSGLNYIEADMLMWSHGAELISHQSLKEQAQRNPEVQGNTWGWNQQENLARVSNNGLAQYGVRYGGDANQFWGFASCRDDLHGHGGRASRLRVQID